MKPLDKTTHDAAGRTAELYNLNPDEVRGWAAACKDVALETMRVGIASASARGISDMTFMSSLVQLGVGYLRSIHPGATIAMLRLQADVMEATDRGDTEALARAREALQLNGMTFTAAFRAERSGGRN